MPICEYFVFVIYLSNLVIKMISLSAGTFAIPFVVLSIVPSYRRNQTLNKIPARCYKKGNLIVGLYRISKAYGLRLLSYVHTGIQDGKGSIDAHFAMAMRHVHRYCNMGHDVVTSAELIQALHANGGVNNCMQMEESITLWLKLLESTGLKWLNLIVTKLPS